VSAIIEAVDTSTRQRRRIGSSIVVLAAVIIAIFTLFAAFGQWIAPMNANTLDPSVILKPPDGNHWFGTDLNGRDVLSRTILATRIDLGIALTSGTLALVIGGSLGLIAGFRGGWIGEVIARISDILLAFPVFVLAMALVAFRGPSSENVILVVTFLNAPIFLRLVRTQTESLKTRRFVEAARGLGLKTSTIIRRHILPNALPPVLAQLSVTIGWAMLLTAGLSFIGAGVRPPTPEWGGMISEGAQQMVTGHWWVALFPGLAITLTVFSFAVMGEALTEWLSPRRRVNR
jgi:peptide/nickel transport system permease protein